ncbi:MAG: hypothetical protein A2086_12175 [Spirochaetes bacterium GWD1_27_9]|nr:MAG: hypothetical protein A2Z98_05375 [Spirochaetes bacterium GWB1_27_13]OHD27608.1 MAG: hypothetical protein A2Y34_18275 [Spirochaetes bacterium GWC1_27_15]OHD28986.1 MAG: hypothetical protein A2086_12175 [Spirochaetes bacterium GWD1_27_9]
MQPDLLAKRIRENLVSQKKRLEDYLKILEVEEEDILKVDADKLVSHINLEKDIIEDISSFKRILEPLEKMYDSSPYKKDESLFSLKSSLDKLTSEVKIKSNKNKEKLGVVIEKIKIDLNKVNNKNRMFGSYANSVDSKHIDIRS